MKDLSQLLLVEQKKALKKTQFELTISPFLRPSPSQVVQWSMFVWEKIYSDATALGPHSVAIPQDGSLNRVRLSGYTGYYQRVPSPDRASDYTSWTSLGSMQYGVIAVSATLSGTEVIIFGQVAGYLSYKRSTDNGQTFGSWTAIGSTVADKCIAACHKSANEMAVVFSDATSNALQIITRNSSLVWSSVSALPGSPVIVSAAVYFDGDYNIITLVNRNNIYSLARIVYGQGYRVTAGAWSDVVYLGLGSASIDSVDLVNQYIENLPPNSDFQTARNEYDLKTFNPMGMSVRDMRAWFAAHPGVLTTSYNDFIREKYYGAGHWASVDSISLAKATDNLDLDAPFVCKPVGQPALMSFIRTGERWTYRLRPATDFYDADWAQAHNQGLSTVYGLALACSSNYVWGTRANEVWRMPIPGALQIPPTAGAGELAPVSIPWGDILKTQEIIRPNAPSELHLELDNTGKGYFHSYGMAINRGYLVRLKYGYAGNGENLPGPGQVYFIEDITYGRDANRSSVILHCLDVWGLLAHFTLPAPAEVNYAGNEYTIYDLIGKLVQCAGGTLSYRSRSDSMTSVYPRMSIRAGESAAGILKRLLVMVLDVLIFDGLNAIIINPQQSDAHVYSFYFPNRRQL